jgi:hypothetical protein
MVAKQRGSALLSGALGLFVVSSVLMGVMGLFYYFAVNQNAKLLSEQMLMVGEATEDYLAENYATFKNDPAGYGVINISSLIASNLLPSGFASSSEQGAFNIAWKRYGSFPQYVIRAIVETKSEKEIYAKEALRQLGEKGGTIFNGQAVGYQQGFSYPLSEFSSLANANLNSLLYLATYVHASGVAHTLCVKDGNPVTLTDVTITSATIVGGGGGGGGATQYVPAFAGSPAVAAVPQTCTWTGAAWSCVGGSDGVSAVPATAEVDYYGAAGNIGSVITINSPTTIQGSVTIRNGSGGNGGASGATTTSGASGSVSSIGANSAAGGLGGAPNVSNTVAQLGAQGTNVPNCGGFFGGSGSGGLSNSASGTIAGQGGLSGVVYVEYIQW